MDAPTLASLDWLRPWRRATDQRRSTSKKLISYVSTILIAFLHAASFAQGTFGNLIGNGSFEAVTFSPDVNISPWVWRACLSMLVAEPQHVADGSNCAIVCGAIYQDVRVVPGTWYNLRFAYGGNDAAQVNSAPLTVGWGTQTVTAVPVDPISPSAPHWRYLNFDVLAASGDMRLSFSTLPSQAFPLLDDVSLTPVPEPKVVNLFTTASLLAFAAHRRFRKAPKV